jgi:hypothetical protein
MAIKFNLKGVNIMKAGTKFYALAIEENGHYGLLDGNVTVGGNHFKLIVAACVARETEDCPEALDIVSVAVVEGLR